MAVKTFASIYVGSSELILKIYEISGKKKFRELDRISKSVELGKDTYRKGALATKVLSEVCEILKDFKKKMKEYQATDYRAFATSAIREASNQELALDYIKRNTGIVVKVLSNSEQRYMIFKGMVARYEAFHQVVS